MPFTCRRVYSTMLTLPSYHIRGVACSSPNLFLASYLFCHSLWLKFGISEICSLLSSTCFLLSFVDSSFVFFLLPSCCACLQILRANRQLVRVCSTVECISPPGFNENCIRKPQHIFVMRPSHTVFSLKGVTHIGNGGFTDGSHTDKTEAIFHFHLLNTSRTEVGPSSPSDPDMVYGVHHSAFIEDLRSIEKKYSTVKGILTNMTYLQHYIISNCCDTCQGCMFEHFPSVNLWPSEVKSSSFLSTEEIIRHESCIFNKVITTDVTVIANH